MIILLTINQSDMEGLRKLSPMFFERNKAENWRVFETKYKIYIKAGGDEIKAMIFLARPE